MTGARIDIDDLLTIDVSAELRKLAQAQLQGEHELPSKLVARAVARGTSHVSIALGRHRFRLTANNATVPLSTLEALSSLVDASAPDDARHRALVELETAGELALIALAGLDVDSLVIQGPTGGLEWRRGSRPVVSARTQAADTVVELRSRGLDRSTCAGWLVDACKFAPVSVELDGRPLSTGFAELPGCGLSPPLRGRLAIPDIGEVAHVYLLRHGVVAGHTSVPSAPCFAAAVELGAVARDSSPAALRAALEPNLAQLSNQAIDLIIGLGASDRSMSAPRRGRLVKALLRAHRSGLRREELERVPALRRIDSGGALLPCSLAEIRQAATAGAVTVLDPRQRADRHVVGERPVFVLDEAERSAIGDQLGCQFQPPPVRAPRRSVLGTLRRTSHVVGAGLTRAMSVAFHPFRRAPLPDAALTDAERTFVSAVREQLPLTRNPDALDAHLCRGAGPIRQARDAAAGLLLPRDNPRVRACIAAHARDRAWLYPGYLIATRGRSQPPPLLRARWLRWLVERGSD